MNYSTVKNPTFSSLDNSTIDCQVDFDLIGEVPFTANPNDTEAHGREIFARCISGEFGPVAPYVAPVEAV
jgi:hypothetical protein